MVAEYDAIAAEYRESKLLPFRTEVEQPSLRALLGDVHGLCVLDLACGEGFYSRIVRKLGAARVHGVDLSPEMVRLAEDAEREDPLGITYSVGDAIALPTGALGTFDLVMAIYLLNYARTAAELAGMARSIASHLAPGGRFVGINDNPCCTVASYGPTPEYRFDRELDLPRVEGSRIHYRMYNDDGKTVEFDNYWLAPATYERTFRAAGFTRFEWVACVAQADSDGRMPPLWQEFLRDCPLIGLLATR